MNPHRTGSAFPDRNVPGDPRLLKSIHGRTPKGTGEVTHVPGGVIIANPRSRPRGSVASCTPWKVTITNTGTSESPVWKASLSFGTLNAVAPANWDAQHTIDGTSNYWPTLNVTTSDGDVTGITTTLETSPQSSDDVSSGAPPAGFKVTLGIIAGRTPCMGYTTNLTATAQEIFRKSRASLSFAGQEPFERFFRWAITS